MAPVLGAIFFYGTQLEILPRKAEQIECPMHKKLSREFFLKSKAYSFNTVHFSEMQSMPRS